MELPEHKISKDALKQIMSYPFPGNVRELENVLERAITLCEKNTITPDDLFLPQSNFSSTSIDSEFPHLPNDVGLETYLADVERKILIQSLENNRFNKTAAAKELKISFRSLRYRFQRLGID